MNVANLRTEKTVTIHSNRKAVLEASDFISKNRESAFIGSYKSYNYFNVAGVVWEIWQDCMGNFPTSNGVKIENFKIN